MLLVDPAQCESSKLNNNVTSTPQRDLLPGPIEPSVSALGKTPSDKDLVLFEPDPEVSSRSNSVVTSIPQRTLLSEPLAAPITPSEARMQNVGQSVLQHYVHTLNNNSTHNIVNVYPQPQVYEQPCQPGHESPDPSYRNTALETPIVEPTQINELPDQRLLESLNIAKRKFKSLEQVNQTKTKRLEKAESENTSLKRDIKVLKQTNQTKTRRLEKAGSEINSLKRTKESLEHSKESLKRKFKSYKDKYSNCWILSNKDYFVSRTSGRNEDLLEFVRINGEYDVESEEEAESKTNTLTRKSSASHKGAKKMMRTWTERRGNDEETEDESDDDEDETDAEDESQTEEESEDDG